MGSWSLLLGHTVTQTPFPPLHLSSQKLRVVFQDISALWSRINRFCLELLSLAKVFAFLEETMHPSQKSSMSSPLANLGISERGICFTPDLKKPAKDKLNLGMLD